MSSSPSLQVYDVQIQTDCYSRAHFTVLAFSEAQADELARATDRVLLGDVRSTGSADIVLLCGSTDQGSPRVLTQVFIG